MIVSQPILPNSAFGLGGPAKQVSGFGVQFILNVAQAGDGSVFGGGSFFPRRSARIEASVVAAKKSKSKKCKSGQKKKGKKCISKVPMTFGPAGAHANGAGPLVITAYPGAAAVKYLKQGKSLKVPFTEVFRSVFGGQATSQTQTITVKGKKPVKKCKAKKGKKCKKK